MIYQRKEALISNVGCFPRLQKNNINTPIVQMTLIIGSFSLIASLENSIGDLINPRVESLDILHTTHSTISMQATVNFTNPTPYSASIPYIDCLLLFNGSALAHVTGRALSVVPGHNVGIPFEVLWSPLAASGDIGVIRGRELLSSYVSGNSTILSVF